MDARGICNLQEVYLNIYDYIVEKEDSPYEKASDAVRAVYNRNQREEVDIYNIILSHLLDEGYVDCLGSAEIILENMSDGWLYDILEAKWGKQPLPAEKMMKKAGRHDYYAGWLRGEFEGNRINKHKKKNITQEMEDESKGRANKIRQVLLQRMRER